MNVLWTTAVSHTPGPWNIHPELLAKLQKIWDWADNREDITWNGQPNGAMTVKGMIGDVIANARPLDESPSLLEALKDAAHELAAHEGDSETVKELRAVIAEATGGAS